MGTVRFGNDYFAAIIGYGDYEHGNITIFHVYYVEGLGHNLFSVGKFCDGDLEVVFDQRHAICGSFFSRLLDVQGYFKQKAAHYEKLGIIQQFSIARTPQQNGVVERRNRTLVEAARTMLIFSKSPEFLWAEAISTACFTQNRSLIHKRYNKTLYELLRGRKPNMEYFHVFRSLCYPTNDREDLGKIKPKAYIGIFIGYLESSRGF
ncbi:retrovirus-related pol polyprotein from transposon TNT 1-94 [Tanacetum coccineum]